MHKAFTIHSDLNQSNNNWKKNVFLKRYKQSVLAEVIPMSTWWKLSHFSKISIAMFDWYWNLFSSFIRRKPSVKIKLAADGMLPFTAAQTRINQVILIQVISWLRSIISDFVHHLSGYDNFLILPCVKSINSLTKKNFWWNLS